MVYKVIVEQHIKYAENLIAEFENLEDAEVFINICFAHCKSIDVHIVVETENKESEEE